MVVPVLRTHLCGYKQADDTDEYGDNRTRALILNSGIHPIGQRQHTQTNPDTESIERAGIGIVSLTRLIRRLVQVNHNGKSRQEEEQES